MLQSVAICCIQIAARVGEGGDKRLSREGHFGGARRVRRECHHFPWRRARALAQVVAGQGVARCRAEKVRQKNATNRDTRTGNAMNVQEAALRASACGRPDFLCSVLRRTSLPARLREWCGNHPPARSPGAVPGALWVPSGFVLGSFRVRSGFVLGSFWVRSGFVLDSFWIRSGFVLGSFWVRSGFVLGSFWVRSGFVLGSFWVRPGLENRNKHGDFAMFQTRKKISPPKTSRYAPVKAIHFIHR